MTPDFRDGMSADVETPPDTDTGGVSLPAEDQQLFDRAWANIHAAVEACHAAIDERLSLAEQTAWQARTDMNLAVSEKAGSLDLLLSDTIRPIEAAIERRVTASWKNVAGLLQELSGVGVFVPYNVDDMRIDLDSETGQEIIDRLQGIKPDGSRPGVYYDTPTTQGIDEQAGPGTSSPGVVGGDGGGINGDVSVLRGNDPSISLGGSLNGTSATVPPVSPPGVPATGFSPEKPDEHIPPVSPPPVSPPIPTVPPPPPPPPPPTGGTIDATSTIPPASEPCECEETVCVPLTEAKICIPRSAVSLPPPPPPPPPVEEGEEDESGEEESEDDELELPKPKPIPTPAPPPRVGPLPYHDPTIIGEVQVWVAFFRDLGGRIQTEVGNWASFADDVVKLQQSERAAAIGMGILRRLAKKLSLADSTAQEMIQTLDELLTIEHQDNVEKALIADRALIFSAQTSAFGTDAPTLFAMYCARTWVEYCGAHFTSYLVTRLGGPQPAISWQQLGQMVEYCIAYLVPVVAPPMVDIRDLWLRGIIGDDHAATLVRLTGAQWPVTRMAWQALRVKPGVNESISLFRRGVYSEGDLKRSLSESGVKEEADRSAFWELSKFVAPFTDLVTWMTRDAFDDAVAEKYGYDSDFDKKFPPEAQQIAFAQGIDVPTMRRIWRSHWRILSNTQLLEALHRLRPDRPEYEAYLGKWQLWNAGGRAGPPPVEPPVVRPEDVEYALQINDVVPGMVKWLMAISYHPLTRTDAIAAYHSGAFSDTQLYHVFRDNGYSDHDAKFSLDIQRAVRGRRLANVTGVWTPRQVIGAFKRGEIDEIRANQLLTPLIVDPNQRADMIKGANEQVAAEIKAAGIKRVHRGVLVGVYTQDEASAELTRLQIAPARQGDLLLKWVQEREGRFREPRAQQIIQWAALNIITPEDAYSRLIKMGYLDIDARRIVYQGLDAARKRLEGMRDKAESKVRARYRDLKQTRKEETAELEKRKKEAEKQAKELQEEIERISKVVEERRPA